MDAFGRQDITDIGYDRNLYKSPLGSDTTLPPLIPGSSPSLASASPIDQTTQSERLFSGDLSVPLFSGKSSFTDTASGYRFGIDPLDKEFKWVIGSQYATIDFNVTHSGALSFVIDNDPSTSNAIFISDASPSSWPAIDVRRSVGTGSGIYVQADSPAGYGLDVLSSSNTAGIHVVSTGSGSLVVPAQLEKDVATSTNYYELIELRGGSSPAVSVSLWAGNNASPNGVLTAGKGDLLLSSNGKTYVNTDGATAWTDLSGSSSVDFQTFTSNGTWTKPAGVTTVYVICTGAGGGGGGGKSGSGTIKCGGAGGGGGIRVTKMFKASELGATESVTVGVGGAAGTGGTTPTTGSAGGFSSFSTLVAYGGGGGGQGNTSGGDSAYGGGGAGSGSVGGQGYAGTSLTLGGTPATTAGANGISGQGGGGTLGTGTNNAEYGGAGGGGSDSAGSAYAGGSSLFSAGAGGAGGVAAATRTTGADGGRFGAYVAGGGGAGGAGSATTSAAGDGTAGTNGDTTKCGYGGGGGGGNNEGTTGGPAGKGGAGGSGGGGGGGGGSSYLGAGKDGGAGGNGSVYVISW